MLLLLQATTTTLKQWIREGEREKLSLAMIKLSQKVSTVYPHVMRIERYKVVGKINSVCMRVGRDGVLSQLHRQLHPVYFTDILSRLRN